MRQVQVRRSRAAEGTRIPSKVDLDLSQSLFIGAGHNYWGNSSDGIGYITTNTSFAVGATGSYDGDTVLKQYSDLTINVGATVTTAQPCRGLVIYVNGNCTISGTLTMQGRGAYTPQAELDSLVTNGQGLVFSKYLTGSIVASTTLSSSVAGLGLGGAPEGFQQHVTNGQFGTSYIIQKYGANGTGSVFYGPLPGNPGTGQSGGGGTGYNGTAGGSGSCFTGGSGAGGGLAPAIDFGGAGGTSGGSPCATCTHISGMSGGTGNPGGGGGGGSSCCCDGCDCSSAAGSTGTNGTGGLLVLLVKGNLSIANTGIISTQGIDGVGSACGNKGGGASGGGPILILFGGTLVNNGTVTAAGGIATTSNVAAGGAGWIYLEQISV